MPSLRVAYIDTETTGLSSWSDRIIELAVVLAEVDWESGRILQQLDAYEGLQDPGLRIPYYATAIHGITDAMVKGHRIDARRAGELLGAAEVCLAHNSGFDKGFVSQILPEAPGYLWGCTCRGIPWKKLYPTLPSTSLSALSAFFGCVKGTAHRAMGDVETTMNLVALPGVQGGRAFQQLVLHKKFKAPGLKATVVAKPDGDFLERLFRKR